MPNFFSTNCNRKKFNTSFESSNIELLESGKNLAGHHPEGAHNSFTKNGLESLMIEILTISRFFPNNG